MNNNPKFLDRRVMNFVLARRAKEALLAGDPRPIVELHWPGTILDDFQVDIIASLFNPKYCEIAIKGCTGAGKGAAVAIGVNLWFTLWEKCKVVVVSPTLAHSQQVLFGEIADWRRRMRHPGPGEIRAASLNAPGKYLVLVNPTTKEGLSGRHGDNMLFVFDEATTIEDDYYDMALTQADLIVALGNPRTRVGWFRRLFPVHAPDETQDVPCRSKFRRCITVSGLDCRNVREGREVIPNQLTRERFDEIMSHPSLHYRQVFGLAKFVSEDAQFQLILGSWLPRHTSAAFVPGKWCCYGLDVGASEHGDPSVLAIGNESGVQQILTTKIKKLMDLVGWVLEIVRQQGKLGLFQRAQIAVDANGVGQGVADRLRELGVDVYPVVGSERADEPHLYANRRAEVYGQLAKRLDPDGEYSETPWALPEDAWLLEELCATEKIIESDGTCFRLIPKHRPREGGGPCIRDMLGRSPDRADAVAYLWYVVRKYAKFINRPRPQAVFLPKEVEEEIARRIARRKPPTTLLEYVGLDPESLAEQDYYDMIKGHGRYRRPYRHWDL